MAEKDPLKVSCEALRDEAKIWDKIAEGAGSMRQQTGCLNIKFHSLQFSEFSGVYTNSATLITELVNGAVTQFSRVGPALRKNADAYESLEADIKNSVDGAY